MTTSIQTITPIVESLLTRTLGDLVENGNAIQQFGLFADNQVQASIAVVFAGPEHQRRVVEQVGALACSVGSDTIVMIADTYCSLHKGPVQPVAPSEDPNASEAIWVEIIQSTETAWKLIPYGRDDHGEIVFESTQSGADRGDQFDGWTVRELARTLNRCSRESSSLLGLKLARHQLEMSGATVGVSPAEMERLASTGT